MPATVTDLVARSFEIIKQTQRPTGAYPACTTFRKYRGYFWFRDSAYIADAMSRAGEIESAEKQFDLWAQVVISREHLIRAGKHLQTRYTYEGMDDTSDWPALQHDGYGSALYVLGQHIARHRRVKPEWKQFRSLVADYLIRNWRTPCIDLWEEKEGMHAYTLACIEAGLRMTGCNAQAKEVYQAIDFDNARLDASLLFLPLLGTVSVRSPEFIRIFDRIESELVAPGGGVWRNADDVFYGGGEWLLLTAALGSCYVLLGRYADADACLRWVMAHAREDDTMPEQVRGYKRHRFEWVKWVMKWRSLPARPLLWSHAMFINLVHDLEFA